MTSSCHVNVLKHILVVVRYFHTEIRNHLFKTHQRDKPCLPASTTFIVYIFLLSPLHFVDHIWLIFFSTPFIVHDEMYLMQCDVRFVNLLLYMNTFDVLILWKS